MPSTATTATAPIPVIDLAAAGKSEQEIAKELCDAAIEHGFIYIRSEGVDVSVEAVDRAFEILFTETPAEEMEKCRIQKNNRGWSGIRSETLDPKTQRAFNFGEFQNGKAQQPLPSTLIPHEAELGRFAGSCHALARRILHLLGVGLEVDPPDFFPSAHQSEKGPSGTTLRFLHYPSLKGVDVPADDSIRAGAHSDYGSVTVRVPPSSSAPIANLDLAPRPRAAPSTASDTAPPILVNVGDLLSYWTNGLLRSTVHRVALPSSSSSSSAGTEETDAVGVPEGEGYDGDRYSIAFLCIPSERLSWNPCRATL
ncbi:unnamed protein product [Parascedosporium putredinis]|uniref:Fe2OG dioxygenase domain-containing protein n=1 Tax=Parascedosporium putredinis TaxID=1442378 RepID=A0A9P1H110_9PEZI|nr:unnamed protein product [Parascedosporium putredinis]CAI7993186.1 unnamed protein product [Parascedosporium putredinis]